MPADTLTTNGRTTTTPATSVPPSDEELRALARAHVGRVRRLQKHIAYYLLGMAMLTPIWALVEWQDNGGFERFAFGDTSTGSWEPWIAYVAIIWGFVVAIDAVKTYFDRPTAEARIEREFDRLRGRR